MLCHKSKSFSSLVNKLQIGARDNAAFNATVRRRLFINIIHLSLGAIAREIKLAQRTSDKVSKVSATTNTSRNGLVVNFILVFGIEAQ